MLRRLLVLFVLFLSTSAALAQSRLITDASKSVKWEPWGDTALARAKKENKPIFVSAGFVSANAWHLMQRDAFTLTDNTQTLSTDFVPVLVDQQLHPEVADALDLVLRTMTGSSGMPVNVILTPELEPFAAAGYLRGADLKAFLFTNIQRWINERDAVRAEGQAVLAKARQSAASGPSQALDENALGGIIDSVAKTWDSKRGGFGREPKLLQPLTVSFLFAYAQQKRKDDLRAVGIDTLRRIAATPVHDQLGGGFHRGSVVADWSLPYFEKMLYDQALMSIAFLDAWKLTRDDRLGNISRATIEAAMRDLREENSAAFWSAQDAYNYIPGMGKPELANGAFYVWDYAEIKRIFRAKADFVFRLYGMSEAGNTPRGVDPAITNKNLLWMREPELVQEKHDELVPVLAKILKWRQGRPAPFRDDKVLAGWNGLMISALARAGAALKDDTYVAAAAKAAATITSSLWNAKTKTLSRAKNVPATVEDYAMLVQGFLDLFEATYDLKWYEQAMALQARQDALFWDEKAGRYTTGSSLPAAWRGLLIENDVDTPGPNGIAAMNLMRIATFSGQTEWRERAQMIFRAFASRLTADGASMPQMASAFTASLGSPKLVVILPGNSTEQTEALLRAVHGTYSPMRAIVRLAPKGPLRDRTVAMFPALKDLQADPDQATVYVCTNGLCEKPSANPDALVKLLQ